MAIPFILGAVALAGAVKTVDALDDMSTAKRINSEAQDLVDSTKRKIENTRSSTNESIKELGKTKISIMSTTMKNFVDSFSKIKNINLNDSIDIDELRGFNPNSKEFIDMKNASFKATELATGGLGSIAAGVLTAAGAYNAVGALAAASTGTAISALSGAAATNATLAWLGGGAIAAGGGGIAAGIWTMIGLTAAPALLVGGLFLGSKAETALSDAKSNRAKAEKFEQEVKNMCSALNAIKDRGNQIKNLLDKLNEKFDNSVKKVDMVIELMGTDWNEYNKAAKEKVGTAAQLAKTIKIVLDTSLLKEDGKLNEDSQKQIKAGQAVLEKFS